MIGVCTFELAGGRCIGISTASVASSPATTLRPHGVEIVRLQDRVTTGAAASELRLKSGPGMPAAGKALCELPHQSNVLSKLTGLPAHIENCVFLEFAKARLNLLAGPISAEAIQNELRRQTMLL